MSKQHISQDGASIWVISRRQMLQRLSLMAAASGLPFIEVEAAQHQGAALAQGEATAANAQGYGTDPVLVTPVREPWPRTLNSVQLELLGALTDILLPAEKDNPAATALEVPGIIDHWISAPYPAQQEHRHIILAGLQWVDLQAQLRFNQAFLQTDLGQRLEIIDDLASPDATTPAELRGPIIFFNTLRRLTAGAYYSSPHGAKELGYLGNVPIADDYPGPSDEAMAHLHKQLDILGLSL